MTSLGITTKEAHAWGILPIVAASGARRWTAWDETSESGLQSEDIFVSLMENTLAGGDEVGQGAGLAEADRTLTQAGNIAGASESPPLRTIDGSDDNFSMTEAWANGLFTAGAWTIILKLKDIVSDATTDYLLDIYGKNGAVQDERILLYVKSSKLTFQIYQNGASDTATPTDDIISGDCYVVAYANGTNGARVGFSATKPHAWSDFETGKKAELSTNKGNDFDAGDFDTGRRLFVVYDASGLNLACSAYYLVAAKKALI